MKMKVVFEDMNKDFLEKTWQWLHEPEVKFLTNSTDFGKEDQIKWYEKIKNSKEYKMWIILVDNIPVGAAGLKRITNNDAHVFWYIGEKKYWGKGFGNVIASEITKKAKQIGLVSIYAETIVENYRSINLLFKEGYKIEKYYDAHYVLRKVLV